MSSPENSSLLIETLLQINETYCAERSTRILPIGISSSRCPRTNERISIRFELVRETGQTTWRAFHGSATRHWNVARGPSFWISKAARRQESGIIGRVRRSWLPVVSIRSDTDARVFKANDRSRTLQLDRVLSRVMTSARLAIVKREQRACWLSRNKATVTGTYVHGQAVCYCDNTVR